MKTANVYRLVGPRKLVLEQKQLAPVGEGMIRAKTRYSAISPGTESAAFIGVPPLRPMELYPRLIGYCNVAYVEEIGRGVLGLEVGDLVYSHQSHRSEFVCPASKVIKLDKGCDPVAVSTAYLFHLGYSALLAANYNAGERVAVIGLGTLGLTSTAVASMSGADVVAMSNQSVALERASSIGAVQAVCKPRQTDASSYDNIAEDMLADLVILTSSSWSDYLLALCMAREGGRVCIMGFPGREDPIPGFNPLDSRYFYDKQLTICACGYTTDLDVPSRDKRFTLKRNMEYLVRKINTRQLDPGIIISEVAPWEDLGDVYDAMSKREPGLFTVVLDWEDRG